MDINFFRSSSYNAYDFCQHRYYLEYNLGFRAPPNIKAELGTIMHKALECMAIAKKCLQDGITSFDDEAVGHVEVDEHHVYTDGFVDEMTSKAFSYYKEKTEIPDKYEPGHYRLVRSWVSKVVNDRTFDPRFLDIISPEIKFDFPIEREWAKLDNGQFLRLKGTIDLVVKAGDNLAEILDWKSGKRKNWASDEEKSYEKLQTDPQLMIYYYAVAYLFPNLQCMLTINFVNDGGPFTMSYTPDYLEKTEQLLKRRCEQIRLNQRPVLINNWKCERLCHFYKTPHPNGGGRSICQYIADKIRRCGMDETTRTETIPGFSLGHYECPGA